MSKPYSNVENSMVVTKNHSKKQLDWDTLLQFWYGGSCTNKHDKLTYRHVTYRQTWFHTSIYFVMQNYLASCSTNILIQADMVNHVMMDETTKIIAILLIYNYLFGHHKQQQMQKTIQSLTPPSCAPSFNRCLMQESFNKEHQ